MPSISLNTDYKDLYESREVNGDLLKIRPIQIDDTKLAKIVGPLEEREFLLARCIDEINLHKRVWEGWSSWYRFIDELNYKDKYLFMTELRKLSYLENTDEFPIYF